MQPANLHSASSISGNGPSGQPSPVLFVSGGGGNKIVRSGLDLPGALGRVGLPSPTGKGRRGGSVSFQGGPPLVTTDKLTSCYFFHTSRVVFASASSQTGCFLPTLFLFANSRFSLHSFISLFGVVQGSQIIAHGDGECRDGLVVWRECTSISTALARNHQTLS